MEAVKVVISFLFLVIVFFFAFCTGSSNEAPKPDPYQVYEDEGYKAGSSLVAEQVYGGFEPIRGSGITGAARVRSQAKGYTGAKRASFEVGFVEGYNDKLKEMGRY